MGSKGESTLSGTYHGKDEFGHYLGKLAEKVADVAVRPHQARGAFAETVCGGEVSVRVAEHRAGQVGFAGNAAAAQFATLRLTCRADVGMISIATIFPPDTPSPTRNRQR